MASQPSLRIGDTERDAVAAELQEHYAQGRLTREEFSQRLDAVFAAKTQRDLSRITSDLPHVRPDHSPLPSAQVGRSRPGGRPAGPAPGEGHWSGGGRAHHRGGFALLGTLLAALASWLLVYDVLLVGLRVPLVGRFSLLVIIFTVLRGLLRRIFGPRRRLAGRSGRRW